MIRTRIASALPLALLPIALASLLAAPLALAAEEDRFIYFAIQKSSGDSAVARTNLEGENLEELVQVSDDRVFGVSVDVASEVMFYTTANISPNSSTVWKASIKGEDPEIVYNFDSHPELPGTPSARITGIEAIPGNDGAELVWLDTSIDFLYFGDSNGTSFTALDPKFPNGEYFYLAVDTGNEAAYVFDNTHSDLYKISAAGDPSYALLPLDGDPLSKPSAIALDTDSQMLYWAQDGANNGIWRVSTDGTGAEQIHSGSYSSEQGGMSLEFAAGMVYWADFNTRKILRRAMDGSGDVETVLTLDSGSNPKGIDVVDLPEPDPRLGALTCIAVLALLFQRHRAKRATLAT